MFDQAESRQQNDVGVEVVMRLHAILGGLWRRRYVIVLPALIFPLFGLVFGLLSDKLYRTHMTILVQETSMQNPTLKDLAVSTNLEERMPALRELVHSRHILQSVGEALGDISPNSSERTRAYYIYDLSRRMNVELFGKDIVQLSLEGETPDDLAPTLEMVGRYFIERIVAPENSAIVGSKTFLKTQLDSRESDLRTAAKKLSAFKSKHAGELPTLHASNVSTLARMRQQLTETRTELAGARAEMDTVRQKLTQANPLVGAIEQDLVKLRAERSRLQARYTEDHSAVRSLSRQIERLDAERMEAMRNAKPLTEAELDRLFNILVSSEPIKDEEARPFLSVQIEALHLSRQRVAGLEQEVAAIENAIAELTQRVGAVGEIERELDELERTVAVRQEIYSDLLSRYEQASITRELGQFEEAERIKIIDAPFTPSSPVNLPTFIFVVLGAVGGLSFGFGLALLLEMIDMRVFDRTAAEKLAGLPVLARLPRTQAQDAGDDLRPQSA